MIDFSYFPLVGLCLMTGLCHLLVSRDLVFRFGSYSINKLDDIETKDNTNISDRDFSLNNNIDLLFKRAVNALTSI